MGSETLMVIFLELYSIVAFIFAAAF